MIRFALVSILLVACGKPRCLDVSLTVLNATSGQVRVVAERPGPTWLRYDTALNGSEVVVRDYYGRDLGAEPVSESQTRTYCTSQTRYEEGPWRVSAWIEPEGTEPQECADPHDFRWPCPPTDQPIAHSYFLFPGEGSASAEVVLDATAPIER